MTAPFILTPFRVIPSPYDFRFLLPGPPAPATVLWVRTLAAPVPNIMRFWYKKFPFGRFVKVRDQKTAPVQFLGHKELQNKTYQGKKKMADSITEYTEEKRGESVPCVLCLPWLEYYSY